jgi:hypothetical protein
MFNGLKQLVPILLVLSPFPTVAIGSSVSSQARHTDKCQTATQIQQTTGQNPQVILAPSPAFQSAPLEALRTIVREEIIEQKQGQTEHEDWNTPSFWINIGLFIVGAIYTVAAWRQLSAIRQQADIARKALTIGERPWLNVHDWEFVGGISPDSMIVTSFVIRNNGKSPAWIVKLFVKMATIEGGANFPEKPDYTETAFSKQYNASAIGRIITPGGQLSRNCVFEDLRTFDGTKIRRLHQNLLYIFVYGFVTYKDAFQEEPHTEGFSAQYRFIDVPYSTLGLDRQGSIPMGRWDTDVGSEAYHYHDH